MINIIRSSRDLIDLRKKVKGSIGFVPTMGALHDGHRSLIQRSKKENDLTIVSIFVNPTQFNDPKDLEKYPSNFEADLNILKEEQVDFLFYPNYQDIYHDNYRFHLSENSLSKILCGKTRPGHFDGVLTVVLKLFNIVRPTRSYFGEKDYQQYLLIKEMSEALFLNIEIIPCPLIREADGLAMSSRNIRLNKEERKTAPLFFRELSSQNDLNTIQNHLEKNGFKIDYLEEHFGRIFGAVFLGNVRLIDNVEKK